MSDENRPPFEFIVPEVSRRFRGARYNVVVSLVPGDYFTERFAMIDIYPVNDYGPLMPGLVMAAVAIVHVFLAQFAVGGGILLCYFQWLAMTGRSESIIC